MALRVRDIEVGGQTFTIANLQLGPLRVFREAVDAVAAKKASAVVAEEATKAVVLSSMQRVDPGFTMARLEQLDGDDLEVLWKAVMEWTGRGAEKPVDPPTSP